MRLHSADRVDPEAEVLADFVDETAGRTATFDGKTIEVFGRPKVEPQLFQFQIAAL